MSNLTTKFFRTTSVISVAAFIYISSSADVLGNTDVSLEFAAHNNKIVLYSDNSMATIVVECLPRVSTQPVVFFVANDPLMLGLQRVSILDSWGRVGINKFVASQRLAGLLIPLLASGQGNFMYLSPAIQNPRLNLRASLTFRATAAQKRDLVLLWGVCSA